MENEIKVSICCAVYNHEKYLRECLDGFISQKTNFKFEVLIHDDASTDNSASIIREYEEKYPDIIKPIYQTENQYSKGVSIYTFLYPRAKGKYIASCEGDDYWLDENKLQSQFDIMENNSNCHLCVHAVQTIKEDGTFLQAIIPSFNLSSGFIDRTSFVPLVIDKELPFQLTSFFRRTDEVIEYINNMPEFAKLCDVGDFPSLLYFGNLGESYYSSSTMSCYRRMSKGSWNERMAGNKELVHNHYEAMKKTYMSYDKYTDGEFSAEIEFSIKRCELIKEMAFLNPRQKARFVLKRENGWYMNSLEKKKLIFILLDGYAPFLSKLYFKIKNR